MLFRSNREYFLAFHTWDPSITGLKAIYYCINGKAYAGNTPNLEAKVGQRVAFHVYGVDNFFHTFHVHGHRWTEPDGTIVMTPLTETEYLLHGENGRRLHRSLAELNPGESYDQ